MRVWAKGNAGGEAVSFFLGSTATPDYGFLNASLTTAWLAYTVTWTPSADRSGATHGLAVRTQGATAVTFFVDDVMIVRGDVTSMPTFSGDSAGAFWTNTPHLSQSVLPMPVSVPGPVDSRNMVFNGTAWVQAGGDITNGLDVDVTRLPALPAGTNEIGGVNQAKIAGNAISANSGNKDSGTQRVVIATDQPPVPSQTPVVTTPTLASVGASVTSVTIRAANNARRHLILWNDSSSVCYVKYGATASTISATFLMQPGGYWEMPQPIYTGIIDGIWLNTNGAMRVTELTA